MQSNQPVDPRNDPRKDPKEVAPSELPPKPQFAADMPAIPGVSVGRDHNAHPPKLWTAVAVAAIIVSAISGVWWFVHDPTSPQGASLPANGSANSAPPIAALPAAPPDTSTDGTSIAAISELAKPWSSKQFTYVQPVTHEESRGIVVKLPGNSHAAESYWGLLLQEPFGTCELQYVSDLNELAEKYNFEAKHPMIVDPCTSALYDPLKMGTLATGAWVRGEIVKGPGFRPPLGVEIRIEGDKVIAGRAEQ
jgi:hypothetical protein